ncbi:response regulator transcription factor [Bacillus arachidis]|uniref:response regulator transcription factor n=1 Tax=Bacillus arachidis TaxID=2819290 RepID=UPI00255CD258|nr:response regulator transcription factor [Bacillus arachidis]WIY59517.1 response regulator transcription factor [Bacillus arachidis]
MYKVMIVEDDTKIAELLQSHINKYGYKGIIATDFENILEVFQTVQPHVVLLDINLPSFDGYYWCRQIRTLSTCPIIFISARSGDMEQVMALDYGADDYITKPFHYEVLIAKIRSQLRRVYGDYAPKIEERAIQQSGLILYPERSEMELNGKIVPLTKNENSLLTILLQRCPSIVSREAILEKLWNDFSYVDDNTLSVNITRVRKKLQEIGIDGALETVRGKGYRLKITWEDEETV